MTYVLQRGQKDVPPYAGTNSLVRPRFWQWPDWNKDSVYFVSNTPLHGSQYLKGRAYYDREISATALPDLSTASAVSFIDWEISKSFLHFSQ